MLGTSDKITGTILIFVAGKGPRT